MPGPYFKAIIFFIILIILFFLFKYDFTQGSSDIQTANTDESLLAIIKEKSPEYEEEPADAYIDDVWKKTPGRNGRKVNVIKSYEKMAPKRQFNSSLLVYDSVSPKVSLHDLPASPIYRGHPEKDMVAFLINVSWGAEHLPAILKTLKEHQIKATFFIEGQWALENKGTVKMIAEQGHLIGNHAFNHPDMAKMTDEQIKEQITKTNDILEAIIGERPQWFAPPSGSFNDAVVRIAHEEEMETILWTVDTIDWQNPSVSVMMNRVMNKIHPGATILMHPTSSIAQGLDQLITKINQKEYRIHTIEQLLKETR